MQDRDAVVSVKQKLDFTDVVRMLSMTAIDGIVDIWKEQGCLCAVRLACRGLRDVVDKSIRDIKLDFSTVDNGWQAGYLPSLVRWPRCSSIQVQYFDMYGLDAEGIIGVLSRPFADLQPDALGRITSLAVETKADSVPSIDALAVKLVQRLPALRELELGELHYWDVSLHLKTRPKGQLGALPASTPQLERLTLPSYSALTTLEVLAKDGGSRSLKRLEVQWNKGDYFCCGARLERLGALQELSIHGLKRCVGSDRHLVDMLQSLPRSLRCLRLHNFRHIRGASGSGSGLDANLVLRLDAGRLQSVEVDTQGSLPLTLQQLAVVLRTGLLDCLLDWQRRQQQQDQHHLGRLSLSRLELHDQRWERRAPRGIWGPTLETLDVPSLLTRLQRDFSELLVQSVYFSRDAADENAVMENTLRMVESFGVPRQVEVCLAGYKPGDELLGDLALSVWVEADRQAPSQRSSSVAQRQQQQQLVGADGQQLPPLPSASELLRHALQRMVATAGATASGAGQGGSSAGAAGAAAVASAFAWGRSDVLLLHGPFIAALARDSDALKHWMQVLQQCSAGLARHTGCVLSFLELPGLDAVLVKCGAGRAAAVAQAAVLAAEAAEEPGGALQVASVAVAPDLPKPDGQECLPLYALKAYLDKAAQSIWDGAGDPNGCGIGRRRLAWLLGLRTNFKLPTIVRL